LIFFLFSFTKKRFDEFFQLQKYISINIEKLNVFEWNVNNLKIKLFF